MNTQSTDPIEVHVQRVAAKDFFESSVRAVVEVAGMRFMAHVAVTQAQKLAGLEIADAIEPSEGMLFTFDPPQHATFHMGSVKFPIDIIFLQQDATGLHIAKIVHNVTPGSVKQWSHSGVAYVLEVNGGTCKKHGLKVGSECKIRTRVAASVHDIELTY